jgi:hypothetical protein
MLAVSDKSSQQAFHAPICAECQTNSTCNDHAAGESAAGAVLALATRRRPWLKVEKGFSSAPSPKNDFDLKNSSHITQNAAKCPRAAAKNGA